MEPYLAAVRFVHFLAAMFVFGAGVYLWAFPSPSLRSSLSRRLRRAAIGAGGAALLSALAWFLLEGASMSGDWAGASDPYVLLDVLTSTDFGYVWSTRVPLLVALVAVLVLGRFDDWRAPTCLAALCLGSLAFVDHAAMQSGEIGAMHGANDALHLLLAGFWIGSLPVLALSLTATRGDELGRAATEAMLHFSVVGHFAVVLLIATGAANIALTTGAPPWPPTSPYRLLLAAKLALVAVMTVLAGFNRYRLIPSLDENPGAWQALRALTLVEFALGLGVLALVSYFGLLDPA